MLLQKSLTPDLMLSRFSDMTPERCREMNICCLLCDIDNTLATYDDSVMPENVRSWISSMSGAGIKIAFVSNNNAERVERFIGDTGLRGYPDAKKPSPKKFIAAAKELGCEGKAAVLGDQLLTDALAAHRSGMRAITVPPIKDRTGAFFRFKRWLERPYIRRYKRLHPECTVSCPEWKI